MKYLLIYKNNDVYKVISACEERLKSFSGLLCDKRIKEAILNKLQEAKLLSLELIVNYL